MDIHSATLIYFSPTQTTRKVLEGIARGIGTANVEHQDLTLPVSGGCAFESPSDGLALIGAPVYGGRVPPVAARRLRRMAGNHSPAVVVVVYGNRAYEDALLELRDLATEAGFVPLAGAAFVGEHSFYSAATPIAHGRPDAQDQQQAAAFGRTIRDKEGSLRALDEMPPLQVPGDFPYRQWEQPPAISPVTQETLCMRCGACATVCPTAAIAVQNGVWTDASACIWCCACVKGCPTGARVMEHPRILRSTRWLSKECAERREPEVYL